MREWPLRIINFLTGFILLSSIHCTIVAVVADANAQTFFYGLIYLPIIILLSTAEKKAKQFWQYLLCAAFSVIIAYVIGADSFERSVAVALTILAGFSYFTARARKKKCWLDEPMYPYLALYVVMYLLELRFENALLEHYSIIGAGVCYLLCMYQTNMEEMQKYMDAHGRLERFPLKRMVKSNYLMMGFQTIIVVIGMCLAPFWGIDDVLYRCGQALRNTVAWLLRGLESEELAWGTEEGAAEVEMTVSQTGELSAFMQVLLKVADVLGWILVIAVTGYIIYRVLKKLYQLYLKFDMNSAENGDQIEQIYVGKTKEEKRELKKQKPENLFWDRSPNARIRKYYKKRVLKDLKETPKPSMTPAEIERGIVMGEEEKKLFHMYYEKARYGNEECTKEEALKYRF